VAQAQCNGGCWPFDKDERAVLEAEPGAAIALAYFPRAAIPVPEQALAGDHTWRVAAQYSARPYPTWRRVTAGAATTYPEMVAKLGPDPRCDLPVQADILIAGCGTGQEAASWALKLPGARITAIDISAPSLAFAAERCAAGGIANIEFRQCDLRDVASLGRRFDAVICSGVLHHLADPERGWNALVKVLKPGGVMRLMVYSAYARLFVRYVHGLIADLRAQRPCDDVLRAARERLIHTYPAIASSADFHTMAGVQDLLFHAHEDPFDIDRVVAGLASLDLDFLGFRLEPEATARYRRDHPEDIYQRDIDSWRALDRQNPHPAQGQLIWWCAKPFKGPV
jgi:SAM-dependent methyltransferase